MNLSVVISHKRSSSGFSLVETALAMLVASVGLTAIIALMPAAMDQGKKAADEAHAAFFADTVFNSYLAALYDTNAVVSWGALKTYKTIPPVTISGGSDVFWKNSDKMSVLPNGEIRTQVFIAASTPEKWSGAGLPTGWEQYDHAFRYRLTMTDIVTNSVLTRRRLLALEVWPGEFGTTNNPYRFATELFEHGFN